MNATKKTNKLRLLSLLLVLCMVAALLPVMSMTAFAATNDAIQEGTAVLGTGANTATAATVYFGKDGSNNPIAWRVIGYNGTGVATASGNMTLITAGNPLQSAFDSTFTSNAYASSSLKTRVEEIAAGLSDTEKLAVVKRTLASGSYSGSNTDCVAGEAISNALLWPLSTAEANSMNSDLRIVDPEHTNLKTSFWWLRSPGLNVAFAADVDGGGNVTDYGHNLYREFGVRPAFNLNLNSVLFTSAAVGGKSRGAVGADALKLVEDNAAGTEWKLTLKDDTRNGFSAILNASSSATVAAGGSVFVDYSNAKTGSNESISAMIVDDSDKVLYYGNIVKDSASATAQAITIPAGLAAGSYTLKIFNEQLNGDKKTDYASEFQDISLTVTAGGGTTTTYNVWVNGTQVTSDNKADILSDGTASYDPDNKTLTLNGYNSGAIRADHALTVTLADGSKNTVTNPESNQVYCISAKNDDLTINGSGNLTVIQNRYNCSAIAADPDGGNLIIDMAGELNVTTYNWHGLYAYGSVTISGSGDVSICIEGNWDGNKGTGIVSETEDVILSGSGKLTVDAQNAACAVRLKTSGKALRLNGTGAPLSFSAGTYKAIVNQADNSSPVGGANLDYYNKVTGEPYTASVVYDHDHTGTLVEAKEATCTTDGNKAYYVCDCGDWFEDIDCTTEILDHDSVVLPALGHDYKTTWSNDETKHWHECTRCVDKTDVEDHKLGAWTETKGAKCTEKGEKVRACTVCNYEEKEEIPALGHDYKITWSNDETKHWHECTRCVDKTDVEDHKLGAWTETKGATCTEKGEKVRVCTVCNYEEKEEIPALGHDYKTVWSSNADQHWHECTRCIDKTDVEDHVWNAEAATEEHDKHCTVCGYVAEAQLTHTHSGSLVEAKEPTFTADGNIAYYNCSCGKLFKDASCSVEIKDRSEVVLGHLLYEITEGKDGVYTKGTGKTLTFKANGPEEDCTGVKIDGALIDAANYTKVSGSTIITLNNAYLEKLSDGEHNIIVVYGTREEATANFKVLAASQGGGNTGGNTGGSGQTTSPQTGDNSNMLLWIALLLTSCGGIVTTVVVKRKRVRSK